MPSLDVPALVIAGQHEGNDADQEELAELLGGCCVFLSGTTHLAPAEAPSAFAAEVVPFLRRCERPCKRGRQRCCSRNR